MNICISSQEMVVLQWAERKFGLVNLEYCSCPLCFQPSPRLISLERSQLFQGVVCLHL